MEIKDINSFKKLNSKITLKGWVVNNRGNKRIIFLDINDGSTLKDLQVVIKNLPNMDEILSLRKGAAVCVQGVWIPVSEKNNQEEIQADKIEILRNSNSDFLLQKQSISLEVLRQHPHIRHRTKLFLAITKIRSTLSWAIHEFFYQNNFTYISAPIITSNDGEGAGESFYIDDKLTNDFFGQEVTLGVTGQLHAEALALGLKKVYTFAPTFRAEKSHTKRHLAEFWMVEPEVAFYNLSKIVGLSYNLIQFIIKTVLKQNRDEILYLAEYNKVNLVERLQSILDHSLKTIDYQQAIKILEDEVKTNPNNKFENKKIIFGMDLNIEHEKFLVNEYFKMPIAVINYPKAIKAFYMKLNDDQKTVGAFDLLLPGVGEIVGGSERENDYDKLKARMIELKMDINDFNWYLKLRQYGYASSAGFGLGVERLVMYITGMDNIRDVISFPRTGNTIFG